MLVAWVRIPVGSYTDDLKNGTCVLSSLVLNVNGGVQVRVHVRCWHWLVTSARSSRVTHGAALEQKWAAETTRDTPKEVQSVYNWTEPIAPAPALPQTNKTPHVSEYSRDCSSPVTSRRESETSCRPKKSDWPTVLGRGQSRCWQNVLGVNKRHKRQRGSVQSIFFATSYWVFSRIKRSVKSGLIRG